MAKYNHLPETKTALLDLENRLIQLIEVNRLYLGQGHDDKMITDQNQGLTTALVLVKQVLRTGHIQRGTPVVPDDIEPLVTTKWDKQEQLGLSKLMKLSG